jgi:hypothetical protein
MSHTDHPAKTVDYALNWWESGECETRNITPGWYRYNNSLNIPTIPPRRGQCGSWNPIWLNGNVLIFNCTRSDAYCHIL